MLSNAPSFMTDDVTKCSVGFHTAELEASDRNIVVELFIAKHIQAVFSTSTLAAGVNLPSFLVIIKGTSLFAGGADKSREYSAIDLQQMAGRAGRPQFDSEGVCVIMTSDDRSDHFRGAMTAKIPIESKMKAKLVEHLNAEIVLETITDIAQAVEWVCSTFYYTRACTSPRYRPCVTELLMFLT
jgi:replicative superfamily II helicase